jgi:hypothetical protein
VVKNEGENLLEEVVELLDGADAPLEPLAGVPEVAHDETLLPPEANNLASLFLLRSDQL